MLIYLLLSISIILTILDNCYSLSWFLFIFILFYVKSRITSKIRKFVRMHNQKLELQDELKRQVMIFVWIQSIHMIWRALFSQIHSFFNFLGVIFVFNLIVLYVDHRSDFKGSEISFSQTFLELVLMRKI